MPLKSTIEQLRERGYVPDHSIRRYLDSDADAITAMLASGNPVERTRGAMVLSKKPRASFVKILCSALAAEKKLYTKIALGDALIALGAESLGQLAPLLGAIGSNQHRTPPEKEFRKKSFPLPRDLAARIIGRIGAPALPELEAILRAGSPSQISEAVDAVGYIAYYCKDCRSLPVLLKTMDDHGDEMLIQWKIIRALQAYPEESSVERLRRVIEDGRDIALANEAKRSMRMIKINRSP